MNNCFTCGKAVRLGAVRIIFNRKRGVAHYIEHRDGSPMHEPGWDCVSMKPYPTLESDKAWKQLTMRWNDANPIIPILLASVRGA
jgi:hypothetical protein